MMPHGYCYTWNPWVIVMHVTGDTMIWLAYMAIPVMLFVLHGVAAGRIKHTHELWLFGLFIGFCGWTHMVEVISVWYPIYWLAGVLKVATGLISLYTAFHVTTCLGNVFDSLREVDHALRGDVTLKEPAP